MAKTDPKLHKVPLHTQVCLKSLNGKCTMLKAVVVFLKNSCFLKILITLISSWYENAGDDALPPGRNSMTR